MGGHIENFLSLFLFLSLSFFFFFSRNIIGGGLCPPAPPAVRAQISSSEQPRDKIIKSKKLSLMVLRHLIEIMRYSDYLSVLRLYLNLYQQSSRCWHDKHNTLVCKNLECHRRATFYMPRWCLNRHNSTKCRRCTILLCNAAHWTELRLLVCCHMFKISIINSKHI